MENDEQVQAAISALNQQLNSLRNAFDEDSKRWWIKLEQNTQQWKDQILELRRQVDEVVELHAKLRNKK